ncbi:SLAC1 family transporter [Saccharolobus islandicus]|uniref:C4-dicarboxylate transporter/malic acid transport protein n=1 Tax=Saccharolobus islandicus (strain REY15A) TaxID=930945 RepID=F0ND58_SACI5|nr:C4-dicarboxylate ABC transporter [Sulfolobus islandicus]ADX86355.1 C4-dicarboxylate transporter/malic acid transport protein [Sulfolobus islandicus REY15A]
MAINLFIIKLSIICMGLTDILGQPICFTMLMGIAGISIASYLGKLILLSLISFGIALVFLILLTSFFILNLKRLKYEMVDLISIISGLALLITRLRLSYPSPFYFIPLIILSIFYFVIVYKVFVSLKQVTFKHHLLGVAITLLSIGLRSYITLLSLIFASIGILIYFTITALILKSIMTTKRDIIGIIDGATWIQMGLSALISFAISPFSKLASLVFWYLALFLLPIVILVSILKLISVKIIRYHPSLWSVIFPQAVFSTDTFSIIRERLIVLPILYDVSFSVLLSAFSLFILFLSFTIFSVTR